ncbi:hypothetical protein YW7DRAFT_05345 [Streptomyces sp. AmelKG-E11A]|nr:hypothetical protein YW7DRAFT_05345 [Streptomyces sp. AmelKG-E11A]
MGSFTEVCGKKCDTKPDTASRLRSRLRGLSGWTYVVPVPSLGGSRSSPRVAFACASEVCPAGRTCSRAGTSVGARFPAPLGFRTWTYLSLYGSDGGAQFPAPLTGRPLGSSSVCGLSSARGRGSTTLLVRARCCGRGWAGISARRLRCSSVGQGHVVPSVSDRGRRIPTGPAPKNRPGAPQRGAGNCANPRATAQERSASRRTDLGSASEGDPRIVKTSTHSHPRPHPAASPEGCERPTISAPRPTRICWERPPLDIANALPPAPTRQLVTSRNHPTASRTKITPHPAW